MVESFTLKYRLALVLAVLTGVAVLALLRMPAAFAWQTFLAGDPALRQFQLTGLEGSVWHGRAVQLRYGRLQAGPLRWDLAMLPLAWGELSATVRVDVPHGFASGDVVLSSDVIALDDARFRLPLDLFAPLIYGSPFVPSGTLEGSLDSAIIEAGQRWQLSGTVVWENAGLAGVDGLDLGAIQLVLTPGENGTHGVLRDRGGMLGIDGTLRIDAGGQYRLDAYLTPRAQVSDQLRSVLGFLGRADAQGRYTLRLNGRLMP
ncbi:MAG TPA: type II secretion system protein N [Gammaproteobacteria bacterium]|nr:type II secretion system protein N [Gammaproteobacteria bacterium]